MKKIIPIIVCTLFYFFHFNVICLAQEPDSLKKMKKIAILKDNREMVRSIFGKPALIEENRDIFHLKEGRLAATYSAGECSDKDLWGKWQVSKGTVIDLYFSINEDIEFSSLKINLAGFKKVIPADTPDLTIFTNKKMGIEYVRFQKYLSRVNILPSKSQYSLHCND